MDAISNLSRCAERRNALQLRMGKASRSFRRSGAHPQSRQRLLYRFGQLFLLSERVSDRGGARPHRRRDQAIFLPCAQSGARALGRAQRRGRKAAFGFDEAYPWIAREHMPSCSPINLRLLRPRAIAAWDARIMDG